MTILLELAGLITGGIIGTGFGLLQEAGRRRNEGRQRAGQLESAWAVMPGSMRRVAGLLASLVLIQVLCPLLFAQGSQWWVSAGVVVAYGWLLFRRLPRR
jgi:hypothetical protein